jgi:diguanylate cyclase (GGDEF)-like protein
VTELSRDAGAELAAEHEALMQFLYLAPVGLVQLAPEGDIVMINPVSAQLLMPLAHDGCLNNLFDTLRDVAPELRTLADAFAAPSGLICDGLHLHLHAGGGTGPEILSLSLVKLDARRLMAVLSDITQQVRRERQLRRSDTWLNALLAGSTDYALASLDGAGRIDRWHDSIGRVTAHTETIVGQPYATLLANDTAQDNRLRDADTHGWSFDEGLYRRADGTSFRGSSIVAPVPAAEGDTERTYCLVLRDLTACEGGAKISPLLTDALTGLANRRAFFEAAQLEMARHRRQPRPTSMILVDADHFDGVVGHYGSAAGDALLCALAQALHTAFRGADVIARVGDARFGVLLPATNLAAAAQVAERLRAAVQQEVVEVDGRTVHYTVSAGVAAMPDGLTDVEALLRQADEALAHAVAQGRNRVVAQQPQEAGDGR